MAEGFVGWGYDDSADVAVVEENSSTDAKSTLSNCKSHKTAGTLHVHHSSPSRRSRSPSLISRLKVLFHAAGDGELFFRIFVKMHITRSSLPKYTGHMHLDSQTEICRTNVEKLMVIYQVLESFLRAN